MTSRAPLRSVLRAPLAVALLAGAASVLLLQGCKDADIEARVAVQKDLDAIASSYRTAAMVRTQLTTEASLAKINELLGKTGSFSAGSPEQQASGSLLAGSMAQTAAELNHENARTIRTQLTASRTLATVTAEVAASLQSLAEATANVSLASNRELLQEQKQIAETLLKQVKDAVKQLEVPIGTVKAAVEAKRSELATLQSKADDLRRRSIELGAIPGFPLVEQAAVVKAEARGIRSTVALDELKISSMEPELALANAQLVSTQSLSSAADSAIGELDNLSSTLASDAQASTKVATEFRTTTETLLAQIAEQNTALNEAYDRVEANLTKAESSGGRASSASAAVAANGKAVKLAAQAALVGLLAERVGNVTAQLQLHEALASSGSVFGGAAKQKDAIEALAKEREELTARAIEKTTDAIASLGEPSDNEKSANRATRNSLNGMLAVLEGKSAPAAGTAAGSAANTTAAPTMSAPAGAGFASPEDYLAATKAFDPASMMKVLDAMKGSMPESRLLVNTLRSALSDQRPMLDAAFAKWGAAGIKGITGASALNNFNMGDAKILERGDTKVVLENTDAAGKVSKFNLVKEGNAWFLDTDSLLAGMSDADKAGIQAMAGMMKQMGPVLRQVAEAVAVKIKAGEVASPADIQATATKVTMELMGGGAGKGFSGGSPEQ